MRSIDPGAVRVHESKRNYKILLLGQSADLHSKFMIRTDLEGLATPKLSLLQLGIHELVVPKGYEALRCASACSYTFSYSRAEAAQLKSRVIPLRCIAR